MKMTQDHEELEGLRIRLARDKDCSDIYSVHTQAISHVHHERYSPEQLKEWAERQTPSQYVKFIEDKNIYVALIESRIVAFGHLEKRSSDNSQYEIKALFVHPSCSRQGIGKKLYRFMEDIAISRGSRSMTVKASFNGEEFYKANGFVTGGVGSVSCSGSCEMQCLQMVKQLNTV